MSRRIPDDNISVAVKKERSRQRLAERYYGKKDLLETWEEHAPGRAITYKRDLKRRLRGHENDLRYRGVEMP